jgi:hypothetical protein
MCRPGYKEAVGDINSLSTSQMRIFLGLFVLLHSTYASDSKANEFNTAKSKQAVRMMGKGMFRSVTRQAGDVGTADPMNWHLNTSLAPTRPLEWIDTMCIDAESGQYQYYNAPWGGVGRWCFGTEIEEQGVGLIRDDIIGSDDKYHDSIHEKGVPSNESPKVNLFELTSQKYKINPVSWAFAGPTIPSIRSDGALEVEFRDQKFCAKLHSEGLIEFCGVNDGYMYLISAPDQVYRVFNDNQYELNDVRYVIYSNNDMITEEFGPLWAQLETGNHPQYSNRPDSPILGAFEIQDLNRQQYAPKRKTINLRTSSSGERPLLTISDFGSWKPALKSSTMSDDRNRPHSPSENAEDTPKDQRPKRHFSPLSFHKGFTYENIGQRKLLVRFESYPKSHIKLDGKGRIRLEKLTAYTYFVLSNDHRYFVDRPVTFMMHGTGLVIYATRRIEWQELTRIFYKVIAKPRQPLSGFISNFIVAVVIVKN